MIARLYGLLRNRQRLTFALPGQGQILLKGQLGETVSWKRRFYLFQNRRYVLRVDDASAKKLRQIVFFGFNIIAKLKISGVDSSVVQIGNVAHGRNRQGQIKAGYITSG